MKLSYAIFLICFSSLTAMTSVTSMTSMTSMIAPAYAADPGEVNQSPEAQAVDSSCSQEATTANCADKKVGTGLVACVRAYKKAHKGFKVSPGCRSAMKQMRADQFPPHKKNADNSSGN